MSEFKLVKEDAPPRRARGRTSEWVERLRPLVDDPENHGVSHRIFEGPTNSCHATASRLKKLEGLQALGEWTIVARTLDPVAKTGAIWATFEGPNHA